MKDREETGASGASGAGPLASILGNFSPPPPQTKPAPAPSAVPTVAARQPPTESVPPPGTKLYFADANGRPGLPAEAHLWTWSGAPQWIYTSDQSVPPHELTVAATYGKRCKHCVRRSLRVVEQTFADGKKHLRCECGVCGAYVAHLKPPPKNLDLEWRST